MPTQEIDQEWQLDRIDQRDLPLDGEFTYEADGSGVRIYIVDYGVRGTHQEFTGRLAAGHSTVGGNPHTDSQNHGTIVASLAAGTTCGPAKGATIVPVQVAISGSISAAEVAEGCDWIIANHPGGPAVVNVSLQFSNSNVVDAAVRRLIGAGFPTVTIAGNNNADVGTTSPARVREAIVVGASNPSDAKGSTSSYGPGVDLWAPGEANWAATNASDSSFAAVSGTSTAAPLVAGVIACILQNYPHLSPRQLRDYLVWASTKGRLTGLPKFTPNRLLYSPLMVEQWLAVERAKRYRPTRRPVREFARPLGLWAPGNRWPTLADDAAPPIPQASGSLSLQIGLSGAAVQPPATVPQATGTLALELILDGSADQPTATVPTVTGTLALELGLTGHAQQPSAAVPEASGTLTLELDLSGQAVQPANTATGTLNLELGLSGTATQPTATVPQASGTLELLLGLSGRARDPNIPRYRELAVAATATTVTTKATHREVEIR